eukprot:TRINITY_DN3234_c0_g2_i1.p1 TRINITY_DN3234_c0_g2~~TRINITY_DN3234_c0_g2_i1.p1  ORF type:complete len:478 (+),score=157.65 TRINITY_DN3234_c0_g2_i1:122-1555(+)
MRQAFASEPARSAAFLSVLFALGLLPNQANAFFQEFFGGGGGNVQFQMGGQQMRQPKFPRGVPDSISKPMSWLKGTQWKWNRDNWALKLERDGDIDAPIQQCRGGQCKWSAEAGKLYILLGDAGLLTLETSATRPAEMKGLKMVGRLSADNQKVTLTFDKIFDHEAVDLDKDLYAALGLKDDAEENEIKKVYRKLSIKYHPDKNPDAESKAKFAEVRDAYEILSDPDKKILYDTGGMEAVQKATKGQIEKTDDMDANVQIGLDELYNGETKKAHISRRIVCRGCRQRPSAPQCKGCGRCPNEVKVVQVQMGPFVTQQQQEVPSKEKCKEENTIIDLHIEKGMRDGDTLNFPRMSSQRPGMLPGAVNVKLQQKKHKLFKRRGDDLHMEHEISLKEALLGWSKTVTHLDGHTIEIGSKSVTKHNQVLKIESEGMPQREDPASFGSLYVTVAVRFPSKLEAWQRELVEKMFAPDAPRNEL